MNAKREAVLAQMTFEEKAALCNRATAWSTTPITRLGVPRMVVAGGPHGVRCAGETDIIYPFWHQRGFTERNPSPTKLYK